LGDLDQPELVRAIDDDTGVEREQQDGKRLSGGDERDEERAIREL
jgi:hypothetical protein